MFSPGDEVLLEEHLACTEEERVRLPPSPLPAPASAGHTSKGRDGDGSARTLASLFGHGDGLERSDKRPFGFSVN